MTFDIKCKCLASEIAYVKYQDLTPFLPIGTNIIEQKRKERNLPSLFNRANVPKHIETAAKYGLGTNNMDLINHKAIQI